MSKPSESDTSDRFVTEQLASARWTAHFREHELSDSQRAQLVRAYDNALAQAVVSHQREHQLGQVAIEKAEEAINRRLETMNDFRAQLTEQQATFLARETFDSYVKDSDRKQELLSVTSGEKFEAVVRGLASRHDTDFEALRQQIQAEREIRKAFEASINTWKWIASFLGASGVAGVVLLFSTR